MNDELNRRRFLGRAALMCGGACLWACSSETGSTAATQSEKEVRIKLSELPTNGVVEGAGGAGCDGSAGVLVGRDAQGVYAYSNVCTHQGGHVPAPDATGISKCCLHGSTYDRNGDLIAGITTSQKPLPHYEVRLEGSGSDATIVVNLAAEVSDRQTRLVV